MVGLTQNPDPFLPDIIAGVVQRCSAFFQNRSDGINFRLNYFKGIYGQATRDVVAQLAQNSDAFPLVYLPYPYTIKRGDFRIYGEANFNLVICMKSDNVMSENDRESNIIVPYLLPIEQRILYELGKDTNFSFPGPNKINYKQIIQPYWGGGDVNSGGDNLNYLKNTVDALLMAGVEAVMKRNVCTGTHRFSTQGV